MEVFVFVITLVLVSVASSLRINSLANEVTLVSAGPDCSAPRDVGNCEGQEEAWHYSEQEGRCIFFIYSGCGGNSNRFASRPECEMACQAPRCPELDCPETCTKKMDADGCEICACTKEEAAELCSEPVQRGRCRALHHKFGWSAKEGRCVSFVYGGCGGNQNNFEYEETCMRVCGSL